MEDLGIYGVLCGCAAEMAGYGGRIIMHHDPFSFGGFMLQIGTYIPSSLHPLTCPFLHGKKCATDSKDSVHHLRPRLFLCSHLYNIV